MLQFGSEVGPNSDSVFTQMCFVLVIKCCEMMKYCVSGCYGYAETQYSWGNTSTKRGVLWKTEKILEVLRLILRY